jgi:histidinol-phosphate aminotransferase
MFKYNKNAETLPIYTVPSSAQYKYRLDLGEWVFPVHPSVSTEITKFNDICRYGSIDEDFNMLKNLIKTYTGLTNKDDTVLLTNGSDNALRLILELFATRDSKVLVPVPSYNNFEIMLNTFDVKQINKLYIDYKLNNDELNTLLLQELNNDWDLCYIINPSMLIGHLLSHENIINILKTYPNTVFIIDEAYVEFSNNMSCSHLIEEFNNLIVVKTFSKFFSLASLRIGYLITNPKFMSLLKPYYNYRDITTLAVKSALLTLKNIDYYNNNKILYFDIKQYVIDNLKDIVKNNKKITDYIMNDGVYFIIICDDPNDLNEFFNSNNIAVRCKNSDLKGAIRITISNYETMEKVFEVLKKY